MFIDSDVLPLEVDGEKRWALEGSKAAKFVQGKLGIAPVSKHIASALAVVVIFFTRRLWLTETKSTCMGRRLVLECYHFD